VDNMGDLTRYGYGFFKINEQWYLLINLKIKDKKWH
jgi:hypothetical protein